MKTINDEMHKGSITIKNTSELPLEKLYKLKEEGLSEIIVTNNEEKDAFSVDVFEKIKIKIAEYIQNIPQVSENDSDKEKKMFTYLYEKIAKNIFYEEGLCIGYYADLSDRAYASIRCILYGKALCSGYSKILKNILSEVGIEALYISGGSENDKHAWNQVKLDGKWYNCDITNDADFILKGLKLPHFLKSNEECTRYAKYPCHDLSKVQESLESISDKKQEELIEEQRQRILKEEEIKEKNETENHSIGKGFIAKIKDFLKKQKIEPQELYDLSTVYENKEGRHR